MPWKGAKGINRNVRSLDEAVKVDTIPQWINEISAYDFTGGFVPRRRCRKINMILCHPSGSY